MDEHGSFNACSSKNEGRQAGRLFTNRHSQNSNK